MDRAFGEQWEFFLLLPIFYLSEVNANGYDFVIQPVLWL